MRLRRQATLPDEDLLWEEVHVPPPELPEQPRIPVVPLLHEGIVLNIAVHNDAELLLLPLIHPYVPTGVVAHDGGRCSRAPMVQGHRLDGRRHVLQRPLVHRGVLDNYPFREVRRHLLSLVERHVKGADETALAAPTRPEDEDVSVRGQRRCGLRRQGRIWRRRRLLRLRLRRGTNLEPHQKLPHLLNLALHDGNHGGGEASSRRRPPIRPSGRA
mmetsp:Transcript_75616/g.162138  ORF Transcript_75616/g.162138 Transcript_75616/m.162138 type:complete len:215 (-) Transcript_75616:174-818(-)